MLHHRHTLLVIATLTKIQEDFMQESWRIQSKQICD